MSRNTHYFLIKIKKILHIKISCKLQARERFGCKSDVEDMVKLMSFYARE